MLIDESHNLRNREGKRYRAIQEYIQRERQQVHPAVGHAVQQDLPRPVQPASAVHARRPRPRHPARDACSARLGETEFIRRHQCPVRSLAAFEKSEYADDWRELMRLYLVRRTRSFIQDNYAETDPANGRKYLTFADGTRSYFPDRVPKTVKFKIDDKDPTTSTPASIADDVVDAINHLDLPRYGLGNYVSDRRRTSRRRRPKAKVIADLSRAGKRLMGFCRTNLFKRLESSGQAFIQSVERHILRNFVFLHAIENDLPLPIGTQDAELLDTRFNDDDDRTCSPTTRTTTTAARTATGHAGLRTEHDFRDRAAEVYAAVRRPIQDAGSSGCRQRVFVDAAGQGPASRRPGAARGSQAVRRVGRRHATRSSTARRTCSRRSTPTRRCWSSPSSPTRSTTWTRSSEHAASPQWPASPATPTTRRSSPGVQPGEQRQARRGLARPGAARPGRHRRAERRPEPSGLRRSSSTTICPGPSSG